MDKISKVRENFVWRRNRGNRALTGARAFKDFQGLPSTRRTQPAREGATWTNSKRICHPSQGWLGFLILFFLHLMLFGSRCLFYLLNT